MKRTSLVSVITIFLNAEKFIQEAIDSVFAQTYENWELLFVDDGSTDRSTEIALQYALQYPDKIRYFEHNGHENRGMSTSRNLGLAKARGDYVAFLDSDDVWLPEKLERQVAILNSQPDAAMVYGPTLMWHSWNEKMKNSHCDYRRKLGVQPESLIKPPLLLSLILRRQAESPATCSVLLRREIIERVGGFEDVFRSIYEDQVFFAKIFLTVPVFVTRESCDRYRQHTHSSCSVALTKDQYHPVLPHSTHLAFLNWLKEYLIREGINDTIIWKPLRKLLWLYRHPILHHIYNRLQIVPYNIIGILRQIIRRI